MSTQVQATATKLTTKAPVNLRILHSVENESGAWYAVRVILDGKGKEIGRNRHPTFNIDVAAELCREDAVKLGAHVWRRLGSLEAKARRMAKTITNGAEAAQEAHLEATRLLAEAEALRKREAGHREKATKMPKRADLPQKPANLPAHLSMKWVDAPCAEDEERRADAVAELVMAAEDRAAAALKDAQATNTAAKPEDVEGAWAAVQTEWLEMAPRLVGAPWG